MNLAPAVCYRAVLARDVRFDGRFFTCVKTTGIYCRPICPARPPSRRTNFGPSAPPFEIRTGATESMDEFSESTGEVAATPENRARL